MVDLKSFILIMCVFVSSIHTAYSQVGIGSFVNDVNNQYQKIAQKQDKTIRKFAHIALKEHPEFITDSFKLVPIYGIYAKKSVLKRHDRSLLSKDSLFTYLDVKTMSVCGVLVFKDDICVGKIPNRARNTRKLPYVQPVYNSSILKYVAEKLIHLGYNHVFCICNQPTLFVTNEYEMKLYVQNVNNFLEYSPKNFLQECIKNELDLWKYISQNKQYEGVIVY